MARIPLYRNAVALPMVATMLLATTVFAAELQFTNAPTATSDLDKRSILTSQFALFDGEKVAVNYNTILRSGTYLHGSRFPFGTLIDIEGNEVIDQDGSTRVSNDNDFSSLIKGDDGKLYMVSHFETRPAAMYLTKLKQEKNGKLVAQKTRPIDFSEVYGGWVHCAGSVTPWGNHLGSEEYPPDGKQWRDGNVSDYNAGMVRYFPEARWARDADLPELALTYMNPYNYGFPIEVEVKNYHRTKVSKHYAMGRVAVELAYVMPDKKTVYISDDGSRVGLFRFVADKKGNLSSGELFAAQWAQTSDWAADQNDRTYSPDGGAGDLRWISLGRARDKEIRNIIDSGIGFDDIFEEDGPSCSTISTRDSSSECLSVKSGMEKAAAFLETSRYAAIMGATIEFEKMEGITFDPATNTMYLAMSRNINEMSDGLGDISVPYNYCGTVYALDLDDSYTATNMYGIVSGIPRLIKRGAAMDNPYPEDGPYAANQCDLLGISEPDNITFMKGYDTLIIGEDTGQHQNDAVWAYNVAADELTRIQTTPYGSETTSPYFYPNINGFAYVMSVIQHPFGESDQDALQIPEEARGYTGYLGPFPALRGDSDDSPRKKPRKKDKKY